MYQPDNAKKIIATEEATHTLAIQYPGTFVFSAGFKHSGLVIEGEHNFFGVSWIEESETMVISFATAEEMKKVDPSFDGNATDKTLASNGIYRLSYSSAKESVNLSKGATGAIRKCNAELLPKSGYTIKWNEDEDLMVEEDNKCIFVTCTGKKPLPTKPTSQELETRSESNRIQRQIDRWIEMYQQQLKNNDGSADDLSLLTLQYASSRNKDGHLWKNRDVQKEFWYQIESLGLPANPPEWVSDIGQDEEI